MVQQPNERSEAEPDYGYWSTYAAWTFEQAAALSVGIDPDVATSPNCSEAQRVRYAKRLGVVNSHRYLTDRFPTSGCVEPQLFISWAKKFKIELPSSLPDAVAATYGKADEWDLTRDYARRIETQKLQIAELQAKLKTNCHSLNAEEPAAGSAGDLSQGNPASEPERTLASYEMRAQTRKAELRDRMLLTMAIAKYRYKMDGGPTIAASRIADDSVRCNLEMHRDTVHDHLEEVRSKYLGIAQNIEPPPGQGTT